ncbi:uncharacterized protein ASPGLDRAFT_1198331 [Aspergillus glaucus CBS 516.65]|uniref:Uncharacterized protein n=1 Tax=Aspergillus glaucus CBS 516.65 TaxID=1160497 RepID=A0A1L9V4B0_ASPGL|nr:hypothetical protein ASPGLDRAFT_1198331 [Aspergillus glaucus CBS 516.65]OJJ78672.1 hypothetical protein ASPGLDRAFT_1198331 [Aspergillus glaucus CBS 516.65]
MLMWPQKGALPLLFLPRRSQSSSTSMGPTTSSGHPHQKRPGSPHMQIGWVDHNSILPSVNAIRMLNASKLGISRLTPSSLLSFPPLSPPLSPLPPSHPPPPFFSLTSPVLGFCIKKTPRCSACFEQL